MRAKIGNCEIKVDVGIDFQVCYNRQFNTLSIIQKSNNTVKATVSVPPDYKASAFLDDVEHYRVLFSVN